MKEEKRRKCYNSGKIGGLPLPVAAHKFEQADKEIRCLGYEPVNPLNNGLQYSDPWIMHMVLDIINLMGCPVVYFQADWRESRGARIEYRVAKLLRKQMIFNQNR